MTARLGQALRDKWADEARETPERVAERIAARKAGEQANAEMRARFGPLTADNAEEAAAWQAARIAELLRAEAMTARPMTREKVLLEALKRMVAWAVGGQHYGAVMARREHPEHGNACALCVARRALLDERRERGR